MDKQNIDTGGGDYAEGNIDQRTGSFIDVNQGTVSTTYNYYPPAPPISLNPQDQRNRRAMLAKVRSIWIEDFLEQTLANEWRMALNLTEQPDAVNLPLNALVQELRRPPRVLPSGIPIIQVFDQMDGALLILGAAGAGKTILLLELARDLIARAEQDKGHPIPVVFNLSSWAEKQRPLQEWLIGELNRLYDVPRKISKPWVDSDQLLPLLDGLDEVHQEQRAACIEAVNAYRSEHGLVPLAICSRDTDYQALPIKLHLQGAIVVQPPTDLQIDAYLRAGGPPLAGLHAAWTGDGNLRSLAVSPLLLYIMAQAFQGAPVELLPDTAEPDEQYQHLFNIYIERMLARRGSSLSYPSERTLQCLSWLAHQMLVRQQETFLLERIDTTLLATWRWHSSYHILVRVVGALLFLIACSLAGVLGMLVLPDGIPLKGLIDGLTVGGIIALALIISSLFGLWLPRIAVVPLTIGVVTTILAYLRPTSSLAGTVIDAAINALIFGIPGSLAGLIFTGCGPIQLVGAFRWTRPKLWRALILGLSASLVLAALFGSLTNNLVSGLTFGLLLGTCCTLPVLLFEMTRGDTIEPSAVPNQALRRSVHTATLIFAVLCCICILINTLWGQLVRHDFRQGLAFGLVMGIPIGLVAALWGGGAATIQHFLLRAVLASSGVITWHYQCFLDYATDRIFLRRVGSGYRFYHRLLMEHFAKMFNKKGAR